MGLLEDAVDNNNMSVQIETEEPVFQANLALALELDNEPDKAYEHYKLATELDVHNSEYRHALGVVCMKVGTQEEAVVHFKNAINLSPG